VKILHVVGARPNFMKLAPIIAALRNRDGVRQILVHTGQHYDAKMSDVFFQDLGMPAPDVHLGVGSGTHAQQTAKVMVEVGGHQPPGRNRPRAHRSSRARRARGTLPQGRDPGIVGRARRPAHRGRAGAPMRRPRRRPSRLRRLRSRLF
jgi:hypothetical protein